jgi:N4-gp56 family major capsid protein
MAETTYATGLRVQQWDDKFFTQYLHDGRFKDLMGTSENAVIQLKEDLTKKNGDSITIALVNRLTNDATTGCTVLEGNEEDMASRSMRIYVDKRRNAVRICEMSEQASAIDLRQAARATLLDWAMEDTRDQIITALGSLNGTAFLSRTAAIGDAWLVDNVDRTVFGAYSAGGSAGGTDLSADLAQLDTTNDLFNVTALDAMILRAKVCNPKIRPMRDPGNGKRYYVVFANPHAFKNLRDSIDTEVLALTSVQMEGAKLFEGGDLAWNGAIIKEVDNLPIYANIGASATAEVTPVYLCGAQAIAYAIAKRWKSVTEEFDYGDKHGIAIEQIYGIRKILFGTGTGDTDDLKDHGVVTGFFATTGAATHTGSAAELP